MSRILIVEDEPNLMDSLAGFLRYEGHEVIQAASLAQARTKMPERPDLVVLDWMLGDGQGVELLREWRSAKNECPVILLTARAELIDKVLGLEMGANDYVTKPFEPRELLARIRVQLRKAPAGPASELLRAGAISLCSKTREVWYDGEPVALKKMEFELLKVFLENPDKVFSRDELLNTVWGYDNYPTSRTIDTHILALRHKFDGDSFETIRGIGYRFRPQRFDRNPRDRLPADDTKPAASCHDGLT
jgi:DNA-binding response OmpR family regulator